MKDKAGTRSDLKAAKRSQVFFLNLEKCESSSEGCFWFQNDTRRCDGSESSFTE